jgi:hypothetical protein
MARRRLCRYLVVRRRDVLGYAEYFGPMVSDPRSSERDAERLYGKKGHTVEAVAWSKVTAAQRAECRRQEKERSGQR